jgi:tellurite resistance protein TerC
MGTWTLWIIFNAVVAFLLLLDLGLFHRRAHVIAVREAVLESAAWVALSAIFGLWIFASHGRGPGLEFFTGYVIELSLSTDNVFVFLLIFQYFRVHSRYQHRLLFWGILGALVLRGAMIAAGIVLIRRFEWILYLFGAFLLYAGFRLFRADHSIRPEKNPVVRWAEKVLPMTRTDAGARLFVQEEGRWLATPLFLVIIVLETTDLLFALDSIPAVFGVTRDPFLVYSSNICAILGLRAFYFLIAGLLPYFRYLDDGLATVLIFIGAKMIVDPWVHISTGLSLSVVGSVIAISMLASVIAVRRVAPRVPSPSPHPPAAPTDASLATALQMLAAQQAERRAAAAARLFSLGRRLMQPFLDKAATDAEFAALLTARPYDTEVSPRGTPEITVGIAVVPEMFERIRVANGSPPLADVPPDQDALEFELQFENGAALDVLTTKAPGGGGAIARFLEKFGEGIQQVEVNVRHIDRATEILRARFGIEPIYPATRPGANRTRVNFFLVTGETNRKALLELVEPPKATS